MAKYWNNIASTCRELEAISAVIFLSILLIFLLKIDNSRPVPIKKEVVMSTVKYIKDNGMQTLGTVQLPDGKEIVVRLVRPMPKIGDQIPIQIRYYKNRENTYTIKKPNLKNSLEVE